MSFIAVICGLKSEAAVVEQVVGAEKIRVDVSGADAGRAYDLVRIACQDGAAGGGVRRGLGWARACADPR